MKFIKYYYSETRKYFLFVIIFNKKNIYRNKKIVTKVFLLHYSIKPKINIWHLLVEMVNKFYILIRLFGTKNN